MKIDMGFAGHLNGGNPVGHVAFLAVGAGDRVIQGEGWGATVATSEAIAGTNFMTARRQRARGYSPARFRLPPCPVGCTAQSSGRGRWRDFRVVPPAREVRIEVDMGATGHSDHFSGLLGGLAGGAALVLATRAMATWAPSGLMEAAQGRDLI